MRTGAEKPQGATARWPVFAILRQNSQRNVAYAQYRGRDSLSPPTSGAVNARGSDGAVANITLGGIGDRDAGETGGSIEKARLDGEHRVGTLQRYFTWPDDRLYRLRVRRHSGVLPTVGGTGLGLHRKDAV